MLCNLRGAKTKPMGRVCKLWCCVSVIGKSVFVISKCIMEGLYLHQ